MVWLAAKMWILLLLAFLLGIFTHWLVNRRDGEELAYEGNGDNGSRAISPRLDPARETDAETSPDDRATSTHDETSEQPIIREYGAVPQKRTRIYESDMETSEARRGRAGLYALPDLKTSDKAEQATDLDSVRKETMQAEKSEQTPSDKTGKPADLLAGPRNGRSDDLTRIRGIGPTLERVLKEKGIFHYSQISGWTPDNVHWIEREIDFPGRVSREKWVEQAKTLIGAELRPEPRQDRPVTPRPTGTTPQAAMASSPKPPQAETKPSTTEPKPTPYQAGKPPAKAAPPRPAPAPEAPKPVAPSPANGTGQQTSKPALVEQTGKGVVDTGESVPESAFDRILAERKLKKG